MLDHITVQVIPYEIRVPVIAVEQALHAIRGRVPESISTARS
jgi:hypothetical protein